MVENGVHGAVGGEGREREDDTDGDDGSLELLVEGTQQQEEERQADEDLIWLREATPSDIEQHVQRVKDIFVEYDVSPLSTPSSSGRNSPEPQDVPSLGLPLGKDFDNEEEEEEEEEEEAKASTRSGGHGRQSFDETEGSRRLAPEIHGGGGGARAGGHLRNDVALSLNVPAAGQQAQMQCEQRHRRKSSLIDTIVLQENCESIEVTKDVDMNSTIFSKLLQKRVESSEEASSSPPNEAGDLEGGNSLESSAGVDEDKGNGDLVSPFLDSLYKAEHAELAWMKPQNTEAESKGVTDEGDSLSLDENQVDQVMILDDMTVSKNSWIGSILLDIGNEEGSPCILSSKPLPGNSCILSIGTSTGMVLVKYIPDLRVPQGAPTTRCEPPPLLPKETSSKITSIATSFGLDSYVAVGYSTGAIALYDVGDVQDVQESGTSVSQLLKVVRQPESKDMSITSLKFTYCRQTGADHSDMSDGQRQKSFRGTAKAAIGAMGMGRACTFLSCASNGLVASHSISVVAPAVSFLRRAPVLSVSSKVRGRLESSILDCSINVFSGGVLAAIVMQNSIVLVQLPLIENQENAQMITLGKVAKPASAAFGAVPCVCWRRVNSSSDSLFELLISWDSIAQSVSVRPQSSDEVESGQSFIEVLYEWRLDQSVASMHWMEDSKMLAIFSEHGHVLLSFCSQGSFHQDLNTMDSFLLQDFPMRQSASHERSFHGSSACLSIPNKDIVSDTQLQSLKGQTALSIACNNGKISYLLILSPLSRAIALFSKNATNPQIALHASLEMLATIDAGQKSRALYQQILVILDATMRKQIFEKNYDLAAKNTFSTCLAIAESQVESNEISSLDESMAVREFLWQDAFGAFGENESSISAFTKALEEAIMKQCSAIDEQFPGSETIRVPPEVMQKLVESLTSHPERIERCVIRMPIFCLDFNQVAKLCIQHKLHTTFAYLYNEGLHDALTPAVEMIRGIVKCEEVDGQFNLMRKLCVYVAYCFRGMRYPPAEQSSTLDFGQQSLAKAESEPLPELIHKEEHLHLVRTQLLKLLLLCPLNQLLQTGTATPLLGSGSIQDVLNGPVIRLLLQVDSCLCLSTLLCAFEVWDAVSSDIFDASLQLPGLESLPENKSQKSTALQLAVDILSQEAEQCEHRGSAGMADAGCIWMFIAYQVATGRARFGSSTGAELLARVLEHLCLAASTLQDMNRRESFERAALRLVEEWWDMNCSMDHAERIRKLAMNTRLYLLCAKIHLYCEEYKESVEFMLKYIEELESPEGIQADANLARIRNKRCDTVFKMLTKLLNAEGVSRSKAREAVTSKLKTFTTIDCNRTAQLIGTIQNASSEGQTESLQLQGSNKNMEDKLLIEHYIEAICQINPDTVLSYLQRNEGSYRLDSVLKIIMNSSNKGTFQCDDAAVYLLERLGDVAGGLRIILGVVREGLALLSNKLNEALDPSEKKVLLLPEAQAIRDCLKTAFELNFRNSQLLDTSESEELWFTILAMFVNPSHDAMLALNQVKSTDKRKNVLLSMQTFLSTLTHDTIMAMSDAMPLTRVATRLVQEHSGSTLGNLQYIRILLESCGHEVDVLATAKRVIDTDLVTTRQHVIARRRQNVSAKQIHRNNPDNKLGKKLRRNFTPWLNYSSPHFSSNDNTLRLHLAPPRGAELMTHGSTTNICSPTRSPHSFLPEKPKFSGELD